MRIKRILWQDRRDFKAIYECEHCGHEVEMTGYDDVYFHQKVIPAMKCSECDKTATDDYNPLTTKYPDEVTI